MSQQHEFLPDKLCKKGHPTIKRYSNGVERCLTCAKEYRKDREKQIREGTWAGQSGLDGSRRERKMQIAALAGAGIHPKTIAEQLGTNQDLVEQVIRREISTDDQLRDLYKDAERKLAPRAFAVAEKLIGHIENVAEGYDVVVGKDKAGNPIVKHVDTPPHHAAVALREMRPFIGMGDRPMIADPASGMQEALATAMTKNPEVARAVVEAVMLSRAKLAGKVG